MKKILSYSLVLFGILAGLMRCQRPENDPGPLVNEDTVITVEERMAALDRCISKVTELNNLASIEDRIQLLAWLSGQPEFSGFGFAGQDVYAIFRDERLLFFYDTPLTDETGGRAPTNGKTETQALGDAKEMGSPAESVETRPNVPNTIGRNKDMPKAKKATLFFGLGRLFPDNTAGIEFMFYKAKAEYQVERKVATIDELKRVSGDAVFYISTHGGLGSIPSVARGGRNYPYMHLWTSEAVTPERDVRYEQDLIDWNLCYGIAKHDSHTKVSHYGITSKFIRKYMSFAENCLIYIDACNSFGSIPGADKMRDSIISKAGGQHATYLGWSDVTYSDVTPKTSYFIFDRLLGSNTDGLGAVTIPKEDPKQRPFDLKQVFDDMHRNNIGIAHNGAELLYKSTIPDEVLIRPSIERMEIDEYTSTLIIYGSFGWDQGKVSVNDSVVNITSWSPKGISCIIPEIGDGSFGDVEVTSAQGIKSNTVPLTEYIIKFNYLANDNGVKLAGVCELRLRADVHPRREKIHETPTKPTLPDYSPSSGHIFNIKGSSAVYTITGHKYDACNIDPCRYQVTESPTPKAGRVEYTLPNQANINLFAMYNWGPEQKFIKITYIAISPPAIRNVIEMRTKCPDMDEVVVPIELEYAAWFGFPTHEIEGVEMKFEIAENYNMRPNPNFSKTISRPWGCASVGTFVQTANWSVITPNKPPTVETPARVATEATGN